MNNQAAPICGILSLVFGIVGLFIAPIAFGPIAIALGIVAICIKEKAQALSIIGLILGSFNFIYVMLQLSKIFIK